MLTSNKAREITCKVNAKIISDRNDIHRFRMWRSMRSIMRDIKQSAKKGNRICRPDYSGYLKCNTYEKYCIWDRLERLGYKVDCFTNDWERIIIRRIEW